MTDSTPGALVRRFAALAAMRWFPIGLYVPVAVLLMQARGLDLATIGGLYAIFGIVTVALELPTGGLADVIGRRTVLIGSSATTALGLAIAAFAGDTTGFAVAMIVSAVGRALGSGPLEAWFVDAARQIEADATVRTGLSRAASAESLAIGTGAIIGGFLPGLASAAAPGLPASGDGPLISLSIPLLVGAVGMVAHGLAVGVLVRERRRPAHGARSLVRSLPATIAGGLSLGLGDGILRRLMLRATLLGVVLSGVELLSPGTFAELLGGEQAASGAFGVLSAAAFAASAVGAGLAPLAAARLGGSARAAAVVSSVAAPAALLLAVPLLAAAGLGYVGVYLLLGAVGPLTSELLHERVGSDERATMVSVESLALQAGGVFANLVLGALVVSASTGLGFVVIATAVLGTSLLLASIPSHAVVSERRRTGAASPT